MCFREVNRSWICWILNRRRIPGTSPGGNPWCDLFLEQIIHRRFILQDSVTDVGFRRHFPRLRLRGESGYRGVELEGDMVG